MQILIIEDEKHLANAIKQILEERKYKVDVVYSGNDGLEYGKADIYDLIILDVMLPGINGIEIAEHLRSNNIQTPIIMLTARDSLGDKIAGLDSGADDYMTKPFSLRELMARVKANLRRTQFAEKPSDESKTLEFGDLIIDIEKYEIKKRGEVIDLTFREFELLKFLATNKGKIFTREVLLNKVWDYEFYGDVRTVDVTIRRLREKIEDCPSMPVYIMTKRSVGYYFGA